MKSHSRCTIFLTVLILLALTAPALSDYCTATSDANYSYEYISHVVVGDIDNTSAQSGYADYTPLSTTMEIGVSYEIEVYNDYQYYEDECGIWVDWNQDEDFDDAGEQIDVNNTPGPGWPYRAPITPPENALGGDTRMRIRVTWGGEATPLPCGDTTWGEVEDYTINVFKISGTISGSKFNDLDADGDWDGGEPGVEGWQIYLDLNGNRQFDPGEPNSFTNGDGYYEITGLDAALYAVEEVHEPNWQQTYPGNEGRYTVTLGGGEVITDLDFGNRQTTGTVISLKAIEDTYANSASPDTNYGSENGFVAGMDGGSVCRSFLKFDLSSIPPGQVVISAKLRLDNSFISNPAPELGVFYIYDSWDELTLTWNDMPSSGEITPIDYGYISGDITVFDVTAHVDTQYAGDGVYSLQIVSTNESLDQSAGFWSKELGWPPMAPTLKVEYVPIFGSGEPNDPYQIWTAEQMNTIGLYTNRWSKHYILMDDISLAAYTGSAYNIIGTSPPTSGTRTPFKGDFDGNNHSISGFSYSGSGNYKGLFGYTYEGLIKNLEIISPAITDPGYDDMRYVGPLVGCASGTDIFGCSVVAGTVEGELYVGGLIGQSNGTYTAECSSSASVSGGDYVGGLVGGPSTFGGGLGQISNSYAKGVVAGDEYVGGLTSDSSDSMILDCYSTGAVSGANNVGGLSGYNENMYLFGVDNVINCFWDVDSSGEPNSAAGTGLSTALMQDQNTFIDAGWDFIEEIDNGGSDDWAMPDGGGYPVCWYELAVPPSLPAFAGGSGTAQDPYLIETAQQLNSIGHNPRLMDKNFKLISDIDMDGEHFYPIADIPYAFTGTFDGNNLTISNIEMSSQVFNSRVGFIGYLYGTEAQIKNLTLYEPNLTVPLSFYVGSLTGINEYGTITNCHSVNANVAGWITVGGLVGVNYWYSTISGCSATGDVSENDFMSILSTGVGGLVGENSFWSEIHNSFAKCNITGEECLGGLVGNNLLYCVITNCYSQGTVTGTEDYIGGFIGRTSPANNTLYCYSASLVTGPEGGDRVGGFTGGRVTSSPETYTACFWDSEINPGLPGIGNATDPNVIGESTANMQTASTFTDEGWDFVDIWTICEGTNYPKFIWRILPADFLCPDGVDFIDYAYFSDYWLNENCAASNDCDGTDFDLSDTVDSNDLKIFCDYWLLGDN